MGLATYCQRLLSPPTSNMFRLFRPLLPPSSCNHCILKVKQSQPSLGPPQIRVSPLHTSAALSSGPMKARKKIDPAIEKAREERRKRKIEKALRKMSKRDRILRPILEMEVPPHLIKEKNIRSRRQIGLPEEEIDRRALLMKEWNRFCGLRHHREIENIDKILSSQQNALDELRSESPILYKAAIQFDDNLKTFKALGPTRTPPIPNYIQDGEYVDKTKSFVVQYIDQRKFMLDLLRKPKKKKKKEQEEE